MHPVMRSDFLNGLLFLDRLQRDSCFHFRAEAPPLPRFHFCSLSEAAILHLIDWSEFWGALHSRACSYAFWANPSDRWTSWRCDWSGCPIPLLFPAFHCTAGNTVLVFALSRALWMERCGSIGS